MDPAQTGTAGGSPDDSLGRRLRDLREARGISLRQLARELGISASAVSQMERGLIKPSVSRLIAIVTLLDVPLSEVFGSDGDHAAQGKVANSESLRVLRAGEVDAITLTSGVVYRRLSPPVPGTEFFESTYPPAGASGSQGEFITHPGIDAGYVTAGRVTVWSGDTRVDLNAGDSVALEAGIPHRIENPDHERPAVLIWVTVR